jgi:hypothetical protein
MVSPDRSTLTATLPPKVLVAWPETAAELLRAFESYERLQRANPEISFEVVLFGRTLSPEVIEAVLRAEDNLQAAGVLLAYGLDAFG